jgi:hypothetical protein
MWDLELEFKTYILWSPSPCFPPKLLSLLKPEVLSEGTYEEGKSESVHYHTVAQMIQTYTRGVTFFLHL